MRSKTTSFWMAVVVASTALFLVQKYAPTDLKPLTSRLLSYPNNVPTVLSLRSGYPRVILKPTLSRKLPISSLISSPLIAPVTTCRLGPEDCAEIAKVQKPTSPPKTTIKKIQDEVYEEQNGNEQFRYGYQVSATQTYVSQENGKTCNDGGGTISGTYCAPNGERYNVNVESTNQAAAAYNQAVTEKIVKLSEEEIVEMANNTNPSQTTTSLDKALNTVVSQALIAEKTEMVNIVKENYLFNQKAQDYINLSAKELEQKYGSSNITTILPTADAAAIQEIEEKRAKQQAIIASAKTETTETTVNGKTVYTMTTTYTDPETGEIVDTQRISYTAETSTTKEKVDEGFITHDTVIFRDTKTGEVLDAQTTSYILKSSTKTYKTAGRASGGTVEQVSVTTTTATDANTGELLQTTRTYAETSKDNPNITIIQNTTKPAINPSEKPQTTISKSTIANPNYVAPVKNEPISPSPTVFTKQLGETCTNNTDCATGLCGRTSVVVKDATCQPNPNQSTSPVTATPESCPTTTTLICRGNACACLSQDQQSNLATLENAANGSLPALAATIPENYNYKNDNNAIGNYAGANGNLTLNKLLTYADTGWSVIPSWDRYKNSFNPVNVQRQWQAMNYDSLEDCQANLPTTFKNGVLNGPFLCNDVLYNQEQFTSSVALGTDLTTIGAAVTGIPGAIKAGSTLLVDASLNAAVTGVKMTLGKSALTTLQASLPALGTFGAISTVNQTGNTTVSCLDGSETCARDIGYTALSWANLGSMQYISSAMSSGVASQIRAAQIVNTTLTAANATTDVSLTIDSCLGPNKDTASCLLSAGTVAFDLAGGFFDLKSGQFIFQKLPDTNISPNTLILLADNPAPAATKNALDNIPEQNLNITKNNETPNLTILKNGNGDNPIELAITTINNKPIARIDISLISDPNLRVQAELTNSLLDEFAISLGYEPYPSQVAEILSGNTVLQLKAADGTPFAGKTDVLARIASVGEPRSVILTQGVTEATDYVNTQMLSTGGKQFYQSQNTFGLYVDSERGFLEINFNQASFDPATARVMSADEVTQLLKNNASDPSGSRLVFVADRPNSAWTRLKGNSIEPSNPISALFSPANTSPHGLIMKDLLTTNAYGSALIIADEISEDIQGVFAVSQASIPLNQVKDATLLGGINNGDNAINIFKQSVEDSKTHQALIQSRRLELQNGSGVATSLQNLGDGNYLPVDKAVYGGTLADLIDQSLSKSSHRRIPLAKQLEELINPLRLGDPSAIKQFETLLAESPASPLLTDITFRKSSIQSDYNMMARVPGSDFGLEGSDLVLRKATATTGEKLSGPTDLLSFYYRGYDMIGDYNPYMIEKVDLSQVSRQELGNISIAPQGSKITVAEFYQEMQAAGHKLMGLDATPQEAINALYLADSPIETKITPKNLSTGASRNDLVDQFVGRRSTQYKNQASAVVLAKTNADMNTDLISIVKESHNKNVGYNEVIVAQYSKNPSGLEVEEYIAYTIKDGEIDFNSRRNLGDAKGWNQAIDAKLKAEPDKLLIAYMGRERAADLKIGPNHDKIRWSLLFETSSGTLPTEVSYEQMWRRNRVFNTDFNKSMDFDLYLTTTRTDLTPSNVQTAYFRENLNTKLATDRFTATLDAVAKSPARALEAIKALGNTRMNLITRYRFNQLIKQLEGEVGTLENILRTGLSPELLKAEDLYLELYNRANRSNSRILGMVEQVNNVLGNNGIPNLKDQLHLVDTFPEYSVFKAELDNATNILTIPSSNSPVDLLMAYAKNNTTDPNAPTQFQATKERYLASTTPNTANTKPVAANEPINNPVNKPTSLTDNIVSLTTHPNQSLTQYGAILFRNFAATLNPTDSQLRVEQAQKHLDTLLSNQNTDVYISELELSHAQAELQAATLSRNNNRDIKVPIIDNETVFTTITTPGSTLGFITKDNTVIEFANQNGIITYSENGSTPETLTIEDALDLLPAPQDVALISRNNQTFEQSAYTIPVTQKTKLSNSTSTKLTTLGQSIATPLTTRVINFAHNIPLLPAPQEDKPANLTTDAEIAESQNKLASDRIAQGPMLNSLSIESILTTNNTELTFTTFETEDGYVREFTVTGGQLFYSGDLEPPHPISIEEALQLLPDPADVAKIELNDQEVTNTYFPPELATSNTPRFTNDLSIAISSLISGSKIMQAPSSKYLHVSERYTPHNIHLKEVLTSTGFSKSIDPDISFLYIETTDNESNPLTLSLPPETPRQSLLTVNNITKTIEQWLLDASSDYYIKLNPDDIVRYGNLEFIVKPLTSNSTLGHTQTHDQAKDLQAQLTYLEELHTWATSIDPDIGPANRFNRAIRYRAYKQAVKNFEKLVQQRYQDLDTLHNAIFGYISDHPDDREGILNFTLEQSQKLSFTHAEINNILYAINGYILQHERVSELKTKYGYSSEQIKKLWQDAFGFEPQGEVQIYYSYNTINLVPNNLQDFGRAYHAGDTTTKNVEPTTADIDQVIKTVGGFHKNNGTLIANTDNIFNVVRDDETLAEVITHEDQHGLFKNLEKVFLPNRKSASVNTKQDALNIELTRRSGLLDLSTTTYDNLSQVNKFNLSESEKLRIERANLNQSAIYLTRIVNDDLEEIIFYDARPRPKLGILQSLNYAGTEGKVITFRGKDIIDLSNKLVEYAYDERLDAESNVANEVLAQITGRVAIGTPVPDIKVEVAKSLRSHLYAYFVDADKSSTNFNTQDSHPEWNQFRRTITQRYYTTKAQQDVVDNALQAYETLILKGWSHASASFLLQSTRLANWRSVAKRPAVLIETDATPSEIDFSKEFAIYPNSISNNVEFTNVKSSQELLDVIRQRLNDHTISITRKDGSIDTYTTPLRSLTIQYYDAYGNTKFATYTKAPTILSDIIDQSGIKEVFTYDNRDINLAYPIDLYYRINGEDKHESLSFNQAWEIEPKIKEFKDKILESDPKLETDDLPIPLYIRFTNSLGLKEVYYPYGRTTDPSNNLDSSTTSTTTNASVRNSSTIKSNYQTTDQPTLSTAQAFEQHLAKWEQIEKEVITPIQQEISKPELLLSRQEKYLDQIFELINLMTKSPKIGSGNRIYRMLSDLGYPNIADFGEWSYSDGTGSWRGYDTSKPYWRDAARWVTDTHADNARNVASNNLLLDSKRVQLAQIELTRQHELQKLTEQYGQPFINLKHTYDDMLARLPRLSPERSKYSEIRNWQKSNAGKYFLLKRSYPKESLEGVGKARFGLDFRVDGLDPINTTLDEESALFLSRWVQSHATEIDWWKIAMQHSTIPEKKPYFDPLISTTHNLSSTDQFGDTTMYIKVPAEKIVPYSIVAREQINYLERELSSIEWQNEDRRNSDEYRDLSLALQKLRTTIADEEFMVIGHINMDEITSVTSDCSVCSIEARKIAEAGGAAIRNQDTQAARHAINLANNHTYNRPDLQHMVNAFAYASMGIASNQKLYFNLSLQELAYARAQFDNYEQSGQLIGGDATIDPSSLDLSGVEPRLSNLLLSLPENGSIAALNPDQVRNNLQQAQDYISELGGNTRNINWLNPIVLRELAQNRAARLFGDANNVFGGNQENNDNSEDETVVPTEATEFTGTATTVVPQMDQGSPGKNNAISVNQTIKLPVGEVTITKELGSGGFGTTYLAKRLSDNFQFVIKVAKNNPKAIQTTIDEYAYLREINETLEFNGEVSQSSIVSAIIDIDDDPNIPYGYILEYAGGTSLKDLVKAGKQLTPGQYKNLYQLARTLDKYELYLSDIYITNILLDRSFPIVIDPLPKKLRDQLLSEDPNQMIGHGDKFRIPLRLNNTQMLDKLFERFPSLIPGSNQTLLDFSPKPIKNPFQQIVNTSTQIGITMNIEGINMFYDFGKKLAQSLKSIKISEKGQVGIPLPALFTKPDELKFNFPDNTNQLTIIRPGDNEDSFSNKYLLVGNRVMQLSNLKYFDLPQFLAELPNDTNVTTNLGDRYTISDGELLKASATITARVVDTTPFSIVASEIPEIDVTLQFSKDAPEYYGATYSLIAEQYFPEINLIRGYPMLSEKLAGSLSPGEIVLVYGGYKEMFSENMPSEEDVDLANNILQELGLEGHSITSNTGNINAETSNTINIMIFGLWPQYYEDRYLHMPWTSTFGKNTIDVETAGKYFKGYAAIFDPHVEKPLGVIPDLNTTMAPSEHLIYIVPNEKIKATILIGLEKSPFIKKEASQKLSDRIFTLKDVIDGKLEKYINK